MRCFDEVIGYESIKKELILYCDVLKNPQKYRKLGVKVPSGILLDGNPGLGKTLMAKCFINESGCKTFTLRKEKPDGDFVKEIKEVYEKAKSEDQAIVFLDDLDKFANADYDHPNAEEYVAVQSCIDEYKAYGVFTIATVNDRDYLPNSLLRPGRFDKVILVQEPNGENFRKIIKYFMSEKEISDDVDVEEIERLMEHNSCADLETIINDAGIYAGFRGKEKIEQEDLVKACIRNRFGASEDDNPYDEMNKRGIAIHEAGHVVVAELLNPGVVSAVSVNRHCNEIGGLTVYKFEETSGASSKYFEDEITRLLGGKAAYDLFNDDSDVGCSLDIKCAFNHAAYLIENCCVYSFDSHEGCQNSNRLLENSERRASELVEKLYRKAQDLLRENKEFFEKVVDELMIKDTLTFRDIQRLRSHTVGHIT